jgi:hypothetical protein
MWLSNLVAMSVPGVVCDEIEMYFSSSDRICFKVLALVLVAARACMYTLVLHGFLFKDINT